MKPAEGVIVGIMVGFLPSPWVLPWADRQWARLARRRAERKLRQIPEYAAMRAAVEEVTVEVGRALIPVFSDMAASLAGALAAVNVAASSMPPVDWEEQGWA